MESLGTCTRLAEFSIIKQNWLPQAFVLAIISYNYVAYYHIRSELYLPVRL